MGQNLSTFSSRFFQQPYLYIVIVLLGVFLKFYKLDQQFFWDDEIATILHTTGIPMDVYEKNIPVNEIIPRQYFDDLLRPSERDLTIKDQISGLMKMPQVTPGHYYYFIFLTRIFGENYMLYRFFSVFIFLLSIPLLFLFTRRIFKSTQSAWIAISIYSVSPFFQIYAQESRYYILWSFAIILLHFLLLRATEKSSPKWWILYAIAGFFAIHVTILMYITLLAHFIYILVCHVHKWKPLFMAQFAIFLSSLPWLIFILINRAYIKEGLAWQQLFGDPNIFELMYMHLTGFMSVLFSDDIIPGSMIKVIHWTYGLGLLGAAYVFYKNANKQKIWFVSLITFSGVFFLIGLDLYRHAISSRLDRYLLLNFIGLIVLLGFVFQHAIKKSAFWFGLLFLLIVSLEIKSSFFMSNDVAIYKRADAYYHVKDANELFSGTEKILIISDFQVLVPNSYTSFISLINASKNENIDIIYTKPAFPEFKANFDLKGYDKVYGMYLSDSLKNNLMTQFSDEQLSLMEKRVLYDQFDVSLYGIHLD